MIRFAGCFVVLASSVCRADVTGKVTLDGTPPDMKVIDMSATPDCAALHPDPVSEESVITGEKGELKNVVVSIKLADDQELPGKKSADKVVIDQKGCMFEPHVVAMMVGQDLIVKNSDPFAHNIDSATTAKDPANKFNVGMTRANDGIKIDPQPKAPEFFKVKCDVHPWMSAYIAVFDHPYFAVTDEAGSFTIKNLPDGTYTLQAQHEQYGIKETKIVVKDGKAEANFVFSVNNKPAAAVKTKTLTLATPAGTCPACAAKG